MLSCLTGQVITGLPGSLSYQVMAGKKRSNDQVSQAKPGPVVSRKPSSTPGKVRPNRVVVNVGTDSDGRFLRFSARCRARTVTYILRGVRRHASLVTSPLVFFAAIIRFHLSHNESQLHERHDDKLGGRIHDFASMLCLFAHLGKGACEKTGMG